MGNSLAEVKIDALRWANKLLDQVRRWLVVGIDLVILWCVCPGGNVYAAAVFALIREQWRKGKKR